MSTLVGVYTTRAGQTSTYWATTLAWALAEKRTVLLVDCDMEGGTIADLLYLRVEDRSIGSLFADRLARPDELADQALPVPRRPNLRVVPGLRGGYGLEISEALRRLEPAVRNQPDDVVVVDLGHPLAHPLLRSPRGAAETIASLFHRTFVVLRDDPALVARSIEVLRDAQPPQGELILCQQRSRAMRRELVDTLGRELPALPVRGAWAWDERRATRMGDSGVPMTLAGMAREVGL
ncbi:MAG: hypothetical protein ABR541_02880 [Candidatus Dormibacteria bacterium]